MHVRLRCGPLSIITPVPLLANKFDVRSVLHAQASLCLSRGYERLRKSKDSYKACFEKVNISIYTSQKF